MLHRSPTVEYSFYNAVKTGDMDSVIRNCKEDAFIDLKGTGVLSRNPLTNIKYHFVVTTAMITRYCIDCGLEPEQAYRPVSYTHLKSSPIPSKNMTEPAVSISFLKIETPIAVASSTGTSIFRCHKHCKPFQRYFTDLTVVTHARNGYGQNILPA